MSVRRSAAPWSIALGTRAGLGAVFGACLAASVVEALDYGSFTNLGIAGIVMCVTLGLNRFAGSRR